MPNVQHPGFLPIEAVGGGTISYVRRRNISNNTNPIGLHDAVKADSNGDILGLGTSSTQSTAVDSVAVGVSYVNASSERIGAKNLPAATTYSGTTVDPLNASYVFVVDGVHNVRFRASADSTLALTNLRNNFEIILGSPTNGVSVQEIDGSTAATTATLPVRVVDFIWSPDNDVDATDVHVKAMINIGQTEPALTVTGL